MGFWGLGFGVWDLGFWGLGFEVVSFFGAFLGLGFRVQGVDWGFILGCYEVVTALRFLPVALSRLKGPHILL